VPFTYTYDITGITTVLKDNKFVELPDSLTISIDSVRINCELSGKEYVEKSNTVYHAFISSAYATTSCHDYLDVYNGLVNKIKNVELICDKDIWGIKKGFPLDTTMYGVERIAFFTKQSMDSLIQFYNFKSIALDKYGRGHAHSRFYINIKRNTGNDFTKFTLRINFVNGESVQGETKYVRLTE
jgi:hypothetical protein